ncbi:Bug family tripartite tricarboxylate transporter substrate binding protein [Azohydromonas lata]|uniref:Tripartite tricarboxylate transporter substrate binding protein n=1 Tax=Azohydromonas lata TaxID=45677 RepID=A0ABU5IQF7_9BURK|nr:tripartite tricarboxylate transporter substrate binding protein [Azohydromonas lata]MDZ5461137.1 tripartite tricarboxylate transporter substrate binding protein [Azohydromonas lata]
MNLSRRRALAGLALGTTLGAAAWPAAAQGGTAGYPTKPVRLIVPVGAGAAPDVVARLMAERLGALWKQTLIVDNKPGAGGIPGMSALAHAPADGYTLGFVPAAMATITPLIYKNPQFNPDTDLTPIATVGTSPLLLVTPASSGIKTLAELARHAKAQPGKVNFAAPQSNSLPHLAGEMVSRAGQMQLFFIPYPSPPAAVTAVLSGDALLTADGLPGLLPHIKAGRLRALAVTSDKRLPGFEDIPTVAETYPSFEAIGWFSLFAPAGVPTAVAEQLNRDVARVMQAPELVARLAEMGIYPRTGSVAEAREFYQAQRGSMKRIVAELGLQAQ